MELVTWKREIAMRRRYKMLLMAAAVAPMLLVHAVASAFTMEQVRQRDRLHCGVSAAEPGFSKPDTAGVWRGLNVDICKAVAAAVLGDADKVQFVPLTNQESVTSLLSGQVDLLSMNLEWSLSYDTSIGLNFCGISFYDGLSFMVPVRRSLTSALELRDNAVCPDPAAPDLTGLASFFTRHNLQYRIVQIKTEEALIEAAESGQCGVVSGNISRLSRLRMQFPDPDNCQILPETVSRRPLGPVVRQGDDGWFNIVKWVLFVQKIAEEEGLTSANIEAMRSSEDPNIKKLLGMNDNGGKGLGLEHDWVINIISQVGNYGEMFERNLGVDSTLKLDRNINELWIRGGLHYAPSLN